MPQDPNPKTCLWSFSFIGHTNDKEVHFLQQGWARFVEMTESERDKLNKTAFTKKLRFK